MSGRAWEGGRPPAWPRGKREERGVLRRMGGNVERESLAGGEGGGERGGKSLCAKRGERGGGGGVASRADARRECLHQGDLREAVAHRGGGGRR